MTMKLRITNEEPPTGYTARVRFFGIGFSLDAIPVEEVAAAITLAPGESTDAYIHRGRFIRIEEVAPTTTATEGA